MHPSRIEDDTVLHVDDLLSAGVGRYHPVEPCGTCVDESYCRIHGPNMQPRTRAILENIVCDVLNQLIGVRAYTCAEAQLPPVNQCMLACVGIRGALTGVLSVAAPLALCVEMAGDVLSASFAHAGYARAECAIGEIANVMAGRMALDMEPVEHTWLSPPAVMRSAWEDWAVLCGSNGTACFDVNGKPLLVSADVREVT